MTTLFFWIVSRQWRRTFVELDSVFIKHRVEAIDLFLQKNIK